VREEKEHSKKREKKYEFAEARKRGQES